jgi:hypothetical protein
VTWRLAFVLTLLFELPVYVLLLRRRLGVARTLAVAAALNLATHPLAWMTTSAGASIPVVEACVWLAESLLLLAAARALRRPLPAHEAFLTALAANALSAGVGLLLL